MIVQYPVWLAVALVHHLSLKKLVAAVMPVRLLPYTVVRAFALNQTAAVVHLCQLVPLGIVLHLLAVLPVTALGLILSPRLLPILPHIKTCVLCAMGVNVVDTTVQHSTVACGKHTGTLPTYGKGRLVRSK